MNSRTLIKKVFEILHHRGLDYCIQNGYENMPDSFPTDIDIFYRNATEKDLDRIVMEIAKEADVMVMQKIAMGYYHFVYWLSPAVPCPNFQFELDFQSELSLKNMPHYYLPSKLLDRKITYKGFFVPAPVDEIIYSIMRRTVKNNFTKRHLVTLQRDLGKNPKEVETQLRNELPKDVVDCIINLAKCGNEKAFCKYYNVFHKHVVSQSKQNNTFIKRISQWSYNIRKMLPLRFLKPAGIDIALLAPDGGGKSAILEALKSYGITSFSGVERKYIRPGMFQNIGQYKPDAKPETNDNPNPHGRKPDGIIKSWIRFLIYLIDFTIGYYVKIVPLKWQRKLVVFDRYYYDYYVDMYRYHYSLPQWTPHFFSFLIPHPSITFVLYAPAEVIYNRKKELTLEETERQCVAFKALVGKMRNAVLINVDRSINEIVQDIVQQIVQKRVELTRKKLS